VERSCDREVKESDDRGPCWSARIVVAYRGENPLSGAELNVSLQSGGIGQEWNRLGGAPKAAPSQNLFCGSVQTEATCDIIFVSYFVYAICLVATSKQAVRKVEDQSVGGVNVSIGMYDPRRDDQK
jgi:hypothetical protein